MIEGGGGTAAVSEAAGISGIATFGSSGFCISAAGAAGVATLASTGGSTGAGGAFGISTSATGGSDGIGAVAVGLTSGFSGVFSSDDGATVGGVIVGAGGMLTGGCVISDGTTEVSGVSAFSGAGNARVTGGVATAGRLSGCDGFGCGAFWGTRAVCGLLRGDGRVSVGFRVPGSIARERGMTDGGGNSRPVCSTSPVGADLDVLRCAGL